LSISETFRYSFQQIYIHLSQDERQLIEALVTQNKAYAEKILDLFEELAKFIEGESATQAMKETQSTSKSLLLHHPLYSNFP
jgi:hypothetical protein